MNIAPLLCIGMLAAAPARAEPAIYTFDPAHTFVHFEVLHFGTSTSRGRFGPVQGSVMLDRAAGRGELSLAIDTRTVSTGLAPFDTRLRRADLLASEEFPQAYFVSKQFRLEGEHLVALRGEFTWRGVSQPLTLTATHFACRREGAGNDAAEICGGDFEGELLRSDFGATYLLPLVANRVRLQVQVEGRRP